MGLQSAKIDINKEFMTFREGNFIAILRPLFPFSILFGWGWWVVIGVGEYKGVCFTVPDIDPLAAVVQIETILSSDEYSAPR